MVGRFFGVSPLSKKGGILSLFISGIGTGQCREERKFLFYAHMRTCARARK
nr:MAG TPA: hypothetical protein [Caudoviricetes sp.]